MSRRSTRDEDSTLDSSDNGGGAVITNSNDNQDDYNNSYIIDDSNDNIVNQSIDKQTLDIEDDQADLLQLLPQFTVRSVVAGVVVGALICFSNMYFGLQTGFITMGSLQSTLLGFLFFKLIEKRLSIRFNHFENVLLQTIAVATATMPLAGGFVGIIPALQLLYKEELESRNNGTSTTGSTNVISNIDSTPPYLTWWGLTLWSLAVAFFGVFFAVPLRKQTILVEKLKFPSGTATAQMIKVLHKLNDNQVHPEMNELQKQPALLSQSTLNNTSSPSSTQLDTLGEYVEEIGDNEYNISNSTTNLDQSQLNDKKEWDMKWKVLFISFGVSSLYTLLAYFVPSFKTIPIFGLYLANTWGWAITPSLSYVGQGMIMGTGTGVSMLIGTIIGWAILGPIARSNGWAPGPVMDWKHGVKGWILWVSLFIMLSESIVSLTVLLIQMVRARLGVRGAKKVETHDPAPENQRVPLKWWVGGLVGSSILCVVIVTPLFGVRVYEVLIAVVLALLTSVLAVRALGTTDLNPVSGIGKISQIVFAGVAPHNVLANLVAGAVAEAGAQQAGDLMQDLKTGHLLRASPRVQFTGQIIGSFCSVFFAVAAYLLYSTAYDIPSADLPAPTASIWLDMAKLVNGGSLADHVLPFCIASAILVSFLPIIEAVRPQWAHYLPSGVALAIGMYVTPNWTLPRVIGAIVQWYWSWKYPKSFREYMIIVASGFVLGEGITSIITALLRAF